MTGTAAATLTGRPMVAELSHPRTLYSWHDRYGIPLDHPPALRFYLDHLFVPHSRREMLWAVLARGSSWLDRVRVTARQVGQVFRPNGERQEHLCSADFVTGELEKYLRWAGIPVFGPLVFLTLEGPQNSARYQTVLFLFDRESPAPCAVAKIARQESQRSVLWHEYETLQALHEELDAELRSTIPRPLACLEAGSMTVLLEAFMPGRSIYFELRNTWQPQRSTATHFRLAGEWLVRFQKATELSDEYLDEDMVSEYVVWPLEKFQLYCDPSGAEDDLIDRVIARARELQGERLPMVGRQGDFWSRNLIVDRATVGVVDWERFRWRSTPFWDLFLFVTSYGLSYPWKLGRWAEPAVAFRATLLEASWLARLVRECFLDYCQAMDVSPAMLPVFFPVFLAERALEEREKSASSTWRTLFHVYAHRDGPACFD